MKSKSKILGLMALVFAVTVVFFLVFQVGAFTTEEHKSEPVEPKIHYHVEDVDPLGNSINVRIEYQFDAPIRNSNISIESATGEYSVKNHVNKSNNRTLVLDYEGRINDTDDTFSTFGVDEIIYQKPKISGRIEFVNGTKSQIDTSYTPERHSISSEDNIGDKTHSDEKFYSDPESVVTSDIIYISDNRELSVVKSIEYSKYGTVQVISDPDRVEDINQVVEVANYSAKIFDSEGDYQYVIIGETGASDYNGATFSWFSDQTTQIIDPRYISKENHITASHEFVHSHQTHIVGEKLEWWYEGSAHYFGALIAQHNGLDETRAVKDMTSSGYQTPSTYDRAMKLADPETWHSSLHYTVGAKVLYVTDMQIRKNTNKTLLDVFNWMNHQEGKVSLNMFVDKVSNYTGDQYATDLEQVVESSNPDIKDFIHIYTEMKEIDLPEDPD